MQNSTTKKKIICFERLRLDTTFSSKSLQHI
uniref:Uncharacterized protein n=1 Tax=Nelumbo nucifera TaxID=4432 RepID=A0A822Y2W4_NELNU|nr:TPA_asm: hypothetical protein HUJ06_029722 [Nelumbo nucifera]